MAAVFAFLKPIAYGIFNKRLKSKLGKISAHAVFRNVGFIGKIFIKPEFLDVDIILHQLQFLPERRVFIVLAERDAEKFAQ